VLAMSVAAPQLLGAREARAVQQQQQHHVSWAARLRPRSKLFSSRNPDRAAPGRSAAQLLQAYQLVDPRCQHILRGWLSGWAAVSSQQVYAAGSQCSAGRLGDAAANEPCSAKSQRHELRLARAGYGCLCFHLPKSCTDRLVFIMGALALMLLVPRQAQTYSHAPLYCCVLPALSGKQEASSLSMSAPADGTLEQRAAHGRTVGTPAPPTHRGMPCAGRHAAGHAARREPGSHAAAAGPPQHHMPHVSPHLPGSVAPSSMLDRAI